MPINEAYRQQVRLLMRLLPLVAREDCFALKGGTAINLFVRDLPRLSVDIDLMYLPMHARPAALARIDAAMKRIEAAAIGNLPGVRVTRNASEGAVLRLHINTDGVQVKVEVSPVLRGVVYDPVLMPVTAAVEDQFGYAETAVVSFEDLYAGKLVAALDRQHPRDLFDVRDLLANEGLTDRLREAFLVYLISHNRPMGEVLSGRRKNLAEEYRSGFVGMTETPVALDVLQQTQHALIEQLIGDMPEYHKRFLMGFEQGIPDWTLLGIAHVKDRPAVLWRQRNLATRTPEQLENLVSLLSQSLARGAVR